MTLLLYTKLSTGRNYRLILGQSFTGYCHIKLWGRTIPSFSDHLGGHGIIQYICCPGSLFCVKNQFVCVKNDCPDSKYTGLAGYTVAAQVVNKTRYCSSPEFYTAVAGETLTQNAWVLRNGFISWDKMTTVRYHNIYKTKQKEQIRNTVTVSSSVGL